MRSWTFTGVWLFPKGRRQEFVGRSVVRERAVLVWQCKSPRKVPSPTIKSVPKTGVGNKTDPPALVLSRKSPVPPKP